MEMVPVLCNGCGAALDVDETTRFATCRFCGSRLAVKHSESTVYTEVLEEIRETSARVASGMESLKLHNELERLDREWMMEREQYAIRNKSGHLHYPGEEGAVGAFGNVLGAAMFVGIGLIMFVVTLSVDAPPFIPLVVIGIVVAGLVSMAAGVTKKGRYAEAKGRYETTRRELLREIGESERGKGSDEL